MSDNLIERFKKLILSESHDFDRLALDIFRFQYQHNSVYRLYTDTLGIQPDNVKTLKEIPFLPIEFFKNHEVKTTVFDAEKIYKSSGTGEIGRSRHFVSDNAFYLQHAKQIFEQFYGALTKVVIAAILPSYQEQGDSSLIAMTDHFIRLSGDEHSGYYKGRPQELQEVVRHAESKNKKVLLLGVTYALLELAKYNPDFSGHLVMETGGMKGRGKELIREELHKLLCRNFNVDSIHSEYGMTELMSQAYSDGKGYFCLPNSMKILIRDVNDPFTYISNDKTGGVNIVDLANITTCSFVETKDLGRYVNKDFYEILGRFDNSDLRGCNLLLV
ncbi:MAG: acyl transferase [Cyclobacteriaceae bacterium]